MEKFTVHTGKVAPLRRSDVDTDQIIPSDWLKRVERTGFGAGLFSEWREDPTFVLNHPERAEATILVAGENFGTGSSREHAVWALQDYGFRVVISPRFADIFRGNSLKGGLLTVVLPHDEVERLLFHAEGDHELEVTVDLETLRVTYVLDGEAHVVPFEFDPYTRWRLMEGLDDIGLTLQHADEVEEFERHRPDWMPTTRASADA